MPQERRTRGTMMCVPTGSPPWRLQVIRHRRSCGCDVRRINRDCRRLKNKRGNVLLRVWRHHLLKRQRATRAFLKAAPTPRGRPVARRGGTLPPSPPFSCPPTKLTEVALGSPRPPSPSPGRRGMGWAGWLGRSERARGRGGENETPLCGVHSRDWGVAVRVSFVSLSINWRCPAPCALVWANVSLARAERALNGAHGLFGCALLWCPLSFAPLPRLFPPQPHLRFFLLSRPVVFVPWPDGGRTVTSRQRQRPQGTTKI
ncbi:hypothetical protein TCDM_11904 [Trypanosoma cruzi Dm28c]|uniref:Uncharacterized protein n=1 Tax=Trypanosoma cruzi Dm28c TaxID=1416333 RepID=V5AZA8_TRYCR|nr:hypothetical protein TCDM_11904 [Trypanosoma cruzi Dm28c]